MLKFAFFILVIGLAATGLAWVADKPGSVSLQWLGYEIEVSVLVAILAISFLILAILLIWSILRYALTRPAVIRQTLRRRREKKGIEALSRGLIAVGSGDRDQARKLSAQAHKLMPAEPLTALLRAQAAQLDGDREAAREVFKTMAEQPETELLGLRGLFLEAKRDQQTEAARQFAERALERNPDLAWSVNALFELQCRASDWEGALRTVEVAKRHKQIDSDLASRRRAVLLTAQALDVEESDANEARQLALQALKLAPELVPAAALAGRIMSSQGDYARAARIIQKTWERSPHPDLAFTYAHLRPGDGPHDRLKRIKTFAQWSPDPQEAAIAVAVSALEARVWNEAREALAPYVAERPQARICTLMARIEGGESGDQGRVREWLARAVRAPRDPAWMADGYISDQWSPVSPVTGELDAFEWKTPVELIATSDPLVLEDTPAEIEASAFPADTTIEAIEPANAEPIAPAEEPATSETERQDEEAPYTPPRPPDDPGPDAPSSSDPDTVPAKTHAPTI